jgi:hypothetical protein
MKKRGGAEQVKGTIKQAQLDRAVRRYLKHGRECLEALQGRETGRGDNMPKRYRWRELARALEITASPDASPFHNLDTIDSFLPAIQGSLTSCMFGGEGPEDRSAGGDTQRLDSGEASGPGSASRASKQRVRSWLRCTCTAIGGAREGPSDKSPSLASFMQQGGMEKQHENAI